MSSSDGSTAVLGLGSRVGAVALGGAIGTLARAGVAVVVDVGSWPLRTLLVNLVGAFLLGLMLPWIGHDRPWAVGLRVGVLGSFTTFSALVVDAVELRDRPSVALGYLAVSLVGGLVLAGMGLWLGRRLATSGSS